MYDSASSARRRLRRVRFYLLTTNLFFRCPVRLAPPIHRARRNILGIHSTTTFTVFGCSVCSVVVDVRSASIYSSRTGCDQFSHSSMETSSAAKDSHIRNASFSFSRITYLCHKSRAPACLRSLHVRECLDLSVFFHTS